MSGIAPAWEERQVAKAAGYVRMSRSGVGHKLSSVHKLRIICCMRNGRKNLKSTLKVT